MPRMTSEELAAYQQRNRRGVPVLDALIEDTDAVADGEELALHAEIIKECRRRGWRYIHSDPTRKATNTPGTPDFIIYASYGRVLNVECKTATGKASKEQIKLGTDLELLGHRYHVVRSMKRFLEIAGKD